MAQSKKPADGGQIIDVNRPGKSAPSDSSKAIIVNNRPILQDPMVVEDGSEADKAAAGRPPKTIAAKADKPATPPADDAAKPQTAAKSVGSDDSKASEPAAETASVKVTAAGPPASTAETPTDADKAAKSSAPADKPSAEPPAEKAKEAGDKDDDAQSTAGETDSRESEVAAQQAAKHQAEIEKLTDSKKYYLPINTIEKRRSRRFVVLGTLLSLLLILAWADIALDAGLIHVNGVKPVTHFFSN